MKFFVSSAAVDVGVVVGSFSLFLALSRITFLVLLKALRVTRGSEVGGGATDEESQIPADGDVSTKENERSFQFHVKKENFARISDLPNQLTMTVGGIVIVALAFVMTNVLGHPLSSSGHSPLTHYSFLVIVGNHSYCMFSSWFFGTLRDRVTPLINHSVAAATYATAACTQELTMLALTGVFYRITFTVFDFEAAVCTKHSGLKLFLQKLSIVGVVAFLLILPTLSVGFSLTKEAIPQSLSVGSTCVLFLSVIYFGLFALLVLVAKIRRFRRYSTTVASSAAVTETSALLRNDETNVSVR